MIAFVFWLLIAPFCAADTLKVATFNTELFRDGPGLLLRDIQRGEDPQVRAVVGQIAALAPDVIALQGIDFDLENRALVALAGALEQAGVSYPYRFAAPPNAGRATEVDLDGDGTLGGPGDAQGYGRFFGQGSMALLSHFPIVTDKVEDFSSLLWRDLPDALLPERNGAPFPSAESLAVQRLSSHGHWVVPIEHPEIGRIHLLTYHASPPVFDGPEDRNGRRNHDETAFWSHYLGGTFGTPPPGRFVLLGDANLDPDRGDGLRSAIQGLVADPRLQDPLPGQPTVDWPQTGPMRVDYVLPSADWTVSDAGIAPIDPAASRHALVWVTLAR
ncbi:endonuclease/exonuclease/phosphatase family protein [Marimonas sp. MJW-29]|uniref:Endonuclease/exonuclease/phosphatase family protein n=1 Tax=Sulfitobacter sediminis TaxID=3234186 RepID=A0ABV3RIE6_9RHOB